MSGKKVIGVDYGLKRIGLSLSDDTATIAFPYKYIPNNGTPEVIKNLKKIILDENIGVVLVGVPSGLKGRESSVSLKVKEFIKELRDEIGSLAGIVTFDERFSSVQARKSLINLNVKRKRRKEIIDSVASTLILQSYLDKNKK